MTDQHPSDAHSLAITVVPYEPPAEPGTRSFSALARCSCDGFEQQVQGMDQPSLYMRALAQEWEVHVLAVAGR